MHKNNNVNKFMNRNMSPDIFKSYWILFNININGVYTGAIETPNSAE